MGEFTNKSPRITEILDWVRTKPQAKRSLQLYDRINDTSLILQTPLSDLKKRLEHLAYWNKKKVNYHFLSNLVKEFENFVGLHKRLYVDFAFHMLNEVGLVNVTEKTKRLYTEYKNTYNDFIFAYTQFAIKSYKAELRIFNKKLPKANEL